MRSFAGSAPCRRASWDFARPVAAALIDLTRVRKLRLDAIGPGFSDYAYSLERWNRKKAGGRRLTETREDPSGAKKLAFVHSDKGRAELGVWNHSPLRRDSSPPVLPIALTTELGLRRRRLNYAPPRPGKSSAWRRRFLYPPSPFSAKYPLSDCRPRRGSRSRGGIPRLPAGTRPCPA